MRKIKSMFAALALLGVLGAGGAAMANENDFAKAPSMAERVEGNKVIVPSQARFESRYDRIMVRRGFVWVAGHYEWSRHRRIFIPGHYERVRRPYAVR